MSQQHNWTGLHFGYNNFYFVFGDSSDRQWTADCPLQNPAFFAGLARRHWQKNVFHHLGLYAGSTDLRNSNIETKWVIKFNIFICSA